MTHPAIYGRGQTLGGPTTAGTSGQSLQHDGAGGLTWGSASVESPLELISNGASEIPLTLQAAVGQTANIFEGKSSSGTVNTSLDPSGFFRFLLGYGDAGLRRASGLDGLIFGTEVGIAFYNYFGSVCGYLCPDNSGALRIASSSGATQVVVNNFGITFSSLVLADAGLITNPMLSFDETSGSEKGFFRAAGGVWLGINRINAMGWDADATAGGTRTLIYSNDHAAAKRIKTGANGTGPGGVGRALYVDDV